MFVNVELNPSVKLDPALADVVNKLALKHPTWVFRSSARMDVTDPYSAHRTHRRSIINGEEAPSGTGYTRLIAVYENGMNAGSIAVDNNYGRSQQRWHYVIRSPRIDNGRKGQTLTTGNPGMAVRTVSKHFAAPSVFDVLGEAVEHAYDSLVETLRDLERPIERGQYCPNIMSMQIALYNVFKGIPFDDRELRGRLVSENFESALANYELAQHMRTRQMKGVIAFRGQYVYLREDDPAPFYKRDIARMSLNDINAQTFDELPQPWQERLAVLQLMQDSELVLDVGYRVNESTFLIVT